jgi:hypothetical protein
VKNIGRSSLDSCIRGPVSTTDGTASSWRCAYGTKEVPASVAAGMPMIDRVHFENFKSLQDVTIDLGRFTALVGPNG